MHAITAKQRAPKVSDNYSSIFSRVSDTMNNVKGKSISAGTWSDEQKTPNLRSFLPDQL